MLVSVSDVWVRKEQIFNGNGKLFAHVLFSLGIKGSLRYFSVFIYVCPDLFVISQFSYMYAETTHGTRSSLVANMRGSIDAIWCHGCLHLIFILTRKSRVQDFVSPPSFVVVSYFL
jgi:hypothetical protein